MAISAARAKPERPPLQRRDTVRRDLLLVILVALAVRLVFAVLTSDTYDYDEFVILLLGRDMAQGAVPYHDFRFFHPPGALVLVGAVQPLLSLWWPAARLLTSVVDAGTAALVWYIGTVLWTRKTALLAGLIYAVSPLALISAVRVGQDPLITFLSLAGFAFLLGGRSAWTAIAAGLCLAAAIWIKYPAAVFLPAYLLAAPRRGWYAVLGLVAAMAALFLPYLPEWHTMYDLTVTFQRTRWIMAPEQRLVTIGLFWIAVNALALPALVRRSCPLWLAVSFLIGSVFCISSQVYYHYFVPFVPYGSLLGGFALSKWTRVRPAAIVAGGAALAVFWAALIDLGGPSPLYVTAAHLSRIRPVVRLLDRVTRPGDAVLADRFEYAYLADRKAYLHYFWNAGVLVNATYLEHRATGARAVVVSYGASSGYPAGFTRYLDQRERRVLDTSLATVWMQNRTDSYGSP